MFEVAALDECLQRSHDALARLRGASLFLTGGTGFIGRWLLAMLARANALHSLDLELTVLTRDVARFSNERPQLAAIRCLRFLEGDVRFFEFPKGRFTHVIHAAADTSVAADNRPLELVDTIVGGTRRVLDFALMAEVRRVLMLSSGAVYGAVPADMPAVDEHYRGACATTDRRSTYGQAKRLAEQLMTIYAAENGLGTVIARAFAFVGPGLPLDAHFAIGNFIRDAVRGRTIVVRGDGTPMRSYLYSGDLAAWLVKLLVDGTSGEAYNVGSD
ncbi:MAG: NAD-dependent epimerase/dehydratase family protein, partial [Candidatus Eremiobacteraeota bacterium]|nr:NAD-dependent epimerase/dehydratase family protein [Candidatus Eremiobacteraeota bacterium]